MSFKDRVIAVDTFGGGIILTAVCVSVCLWTEIYGITHKIEKLRVNFHEICKRQNMDQERVDNYGGYG